MATRNSNYDKLTPAQKAELKKAQQEAIARARLSAINTQRASTQSLAEAQRLAGNVGDIGAAAAAGGKFVDTSAATGYQGGVTTGAQTNALMGTITDPFAAARDAAIKNRKLVKGKQWTNRFKRGLLKDYTSTIKDTTLSGGSGTSAIGFDTPTTNTKFVESL